MMPARLAAPFNVSNSKTLSMCCCSSSWTMIIASEHKNLNLQYGWRSLANQSGTSVRLKEAISSDKLEQTESPHTYGGNQFIEHKEYGIMEQCSASTDYFRYEGMKSLWHSLAQVAFRSLWLLDNMRKSGPPQSNY